MAFFMLSAGSAAAQESEAEVAQVPLFISASVDPNILFIIDDSGSMHFEIMPDEPENPWQRFRARYAYPRDSGVYGGSYYDGYVPTFSDNPYNSFYRSPANNTVYYNPSITYKPWYGVDSEGDSFADAPVDAAWNNPFHKNRGTRNLTQETTEDVSHGWIKCHDSATCYLGEQTNIGFFWHIWVHRETFWPAVYFWPKTQEELGEGVAWDAWNFDHYHKVEIRDTQTTYTGHGREKRTDCADRANAKCSYAEEIQNFANWYSYYRSRILASRAAIGAGFAQQGERMRVGYGAINHGYSGNNPHLKGPDKAVTTVDDFSIGTIKRGIRPFSGSDREKFFEHLYGDNIPAAGTPLRRALMDAGTYFSETCNKGPWGGTPGKDDGQDQISCRTSYTILMTDGYWNGWAPSLGNVDSDMGPPFSDNYSNTLADVAMYYWKNDLHKTLDNNVPPSQGREIDNPATWQHMVTFGVGLGVTGSMNPDDVWAKARADEAIAWPDPDPDSNPDPDPDPEVTDVNQAKIDDLLHAAVNSRGGFFSTTNPQVFSEELSGILDDIVNRGMGTAASIATNSTRTIGNTYVYQARFDSNYWNGDIIAYRVKRDGSLEQENNENKPAWSTSDTGKIPVHNERNIFTWNETTGSGVEFLWNNNISSTQQTALGSEDVLNWLRGDHSKEERNDGALRNRIDGYNQPWVLGDIVNSDPLVVGSLNFGYDKMTGYTAFRNDNRNRKQVLYVGANDGMLHAFDAMTGEELFAYVPNLVFGDLAKLTQPEYQHQYYVDGPPVVGDAYIDDDWKTILVGTLGAGGKGIFALDITDPDDFDESKVLWEFQHDDLGYVMGQPVIGKMKNGKWAVILGNGYHSKNNKASLLIVDLETGKLMERNNDIIGKLELPGDNSSANGLSPVTLLAGDDRIMKYAYAGDLQGNLWKFDLTATGGNQWKIAYGQPNSRLPLFRAKDDSGNAQPITAPVEIRKSHEEGHLQILFGTGKYFEVGDNSVVSSPPVQSFYSIIDKGEPVPVSNKRDDIKLLKQEISHEGLLKTKKNEEDSSDPLRVVSNHVAGEGSYYGCYLDLESPDTNVGGRGERVVSAPLLRHGRVIFSTLIPSDDPCEPGGSSWLMELDALTCGRTDNPVFDIDGDGKVDGDDMVLVDGEWVSAAGIDIGIGITSTPAVITGLDGLEFRFLGGSSGEMGKVTGAGSDADAPHRRSWRQIQ
ncbi:pilus assembly protein PilY [Desulfobotulus mexicanus]|uniref:Pilus assembly protein PilY n=2 Tax=Desulfobotulus mexicanus TaxID=2586642 RepID=A0A5Q4VBM3_9BACT|nr:pilus assembly protein PilY [Desulfobotulus mexicanus]